MKSGLPANLPSIERAKLPAAYSSAKEALTKCERLDECKDWADKAEALASYAKQAQDDAMRKMADRIQARAIRRCGQLLGEIKAATNQHKSARGGDPPSRSEAARRAGLSRDQKRTALRVARVGEEDFEAAVESDDPPTVTALADRGRLPGPKFDLHGRDPKDFKIATAVVGWTNEANAFAATHDPEAAARGLLPRELRQSDSLLGKVMFVGGWLDEFHAQVEKVLRRTK